MPQAGHLPSPHTFPERLGGTGVVRTEGDGEERSAVVYTEEGDEWHLGIQKMAAEGELK